MRGNRIIINRRSFLKGYRYQYQVTFCMTANATQEKVAEYVYWSIFADSCYEISTNYGYNHHSTEVSIRSLFMLN